MKKIIATALSAISTIGTTIIIGLAVDNMIEKKIVKEVDRRLKEVKAKETKTKEKEKIGEEIFKETEEVKEKFLESHKERMAELNKELDKLNDLLNDHVVINKEDIEIITKNNKNQKILEECDKALDSLIADMEKEKTDKA